MVENTIASNRLRDVAVVADTRRVEHSGAHDLVVRLTKRDDDRLQGRELTDDLRHVVRLEVGEDHPPSPWA